MKYPLLALLLILAGCATSNRTPGAGEWIELFDGKTLTGWRANVEPGSFTVVDGAIKANSTKDRSHLFYVGPGSADLVKFKNFELEAVVRSEPNANSGIFFHTDMAVRDAMNHLRNGYEVQLNSSAREPRKTGSLYAVVDLDRSPVDETQWFTVNIRVLEKNIQVRLNDALVVDYTEPDNVQRPPERAGRVLLPEGGAIALQAHDPNSTFFFRRLRIRELP